ncbi:MAG TPA: hypothetical protein VHT25_07370 [Solirubrobacteraceae bacterium]|jgi:hypothetical protein|nr:hypothetical protein [Solirubrobacteraceae bacterium]
MLEIRALRPEETQSAVELLARGMRDNPLHMAASGEDAAGPNRGDAAASNV